VDFLAGLFEGFFSSSSSDCEFRRIKNKVKHKINNKLEGTQRTGPPET
jgi:hypothetical protein